MLLAADIETGAGARANVGIETAAGAVKHTAGSNGSSGKIGPGSPAPAAKPGFASAENVSFRSCWQSIIDAAGSTGPAPKSAGTVVAQDGTLEENHREAVGIGERKSFPESDHGGSALIASKGDQEEIPSDSTLSAPAPTSVPAWTRPQSGSVCRRMVDAPAPQSTASSKSANAASLAQHEGAGRRNGVPATGHGISQAAVAAAADPMVSMAPASTAPVQMGPAQDTAGQTIPSAMMNANKNPVASASDVGNLGSELSGGPYAAGRPLLEAREVSNLQRLGRAEGSAGEGRGAASSEEPEIPEQAAQPSSPIEEPKEPNASLSHADPTARDVSYLTEQAGDGEPGTFRPGAADPQLPASPRGAENATRPIGTPDIGHQLTTARSNTVARREIVDSPHSSAPHPRSTAGPVVTPNFAGSATISQGVVQTTGMSAQTAFSIAAPKSGSEHITEGPFAALDFGTEGDTPSWIRSTGQHAEAGFQDPSFGWIGVRADLSGGSIHAALLPGSAEAAQALSGHLPGLSNYLAQEHSRVSTLTLDTAGGWGDGLAGSNTGQQPQQGTGEGQGRQVPGEVQRSSASDAATHSDNSAKNVTHGEDGLDSPRLYGESHGTRISVIA